MITKLNKDTQSKVRQHNGRRRGEEKMSPWMRVDDTRKAQPLLLSCGKNVLPYSHTIQSPIV